MVLAARQRYLDAAHALHPFLQRAAPTAERLLRADFTADGSHADLDTVDLRQLAMQHTQHFAHMSALHHTTAVLSLLASINMASGFLSADEIEMRWQQLTQGVQSARQQFDTGCVSRLRTDRASVTVSALAEQLRLWLEGAATAMRQLGERPIDSPQSFDECVQELTRCIVERDVRNSNIQRVLALRTDLSPSDPNRAGLDDMERTLQWLSEQVVAMQRRLEEAINTRMVARQEWGRYRADPVCSLVLRHLCVGLSVSTVS